MYGGRELRRGILQRGMGYVLAVRANHTVTTGSGRTVTAAGAACAIPGRAWQRMRTGSGTKGTRCYDWTMLEVTSDDTPAGMPAGAASCWSGGTATPARWRIEEDHQLSKQVAGLDAGQVIRWTSWRRWTALCLLAYLYLAVAVVLQRQHDAVDIPVTVPELLRLLRDTVYRRPGETRPTGFTGPPGDAAINIAPAKPTVAGTPAPRRHHNPR